MMHQAADIRPFAAPRLIPPRPPSCMCVIIETCRFKSALSKGWRFQNSFVFWQVAIDKHPNKTLQYQESSLPMAPVRTTALRKEQTPDQIEYGEAILVAVRLKAQRQIELVAPHQHEDVIRLYSLILDIQAVQEKLSRERRRISVCR